MLRTSCGSLHVDGIKCSQVVGYPIGGNNELLALGEKLHSKGDPLHAMGRWDVVRKQQIAGRTGTSRSHLELYFGPAD